MERRLGGLLNSRRPGRRFFLFCGSFISEPLERRLLLSGGPQISVGPVMDVSRTTDYESTGSITIDPTNPNRLFAVSDHGHGLLAAWSDDAGATWTARLLDDALPPACCDAHAAFDRFGGLHLVYLEAPAPRGVVVAASYDGGRTFAKSRVFSAADADHPSLAIGGDASSVDAQSVWVSFTAGGAIVASGAAVTGPGPAGAGAFSDLRNVARTAGGFSDIAVGDEGRVVATWQNPVKGQGPADLFIARDDDGLGAGKFSQAVRVATTNVGGFDRIPAQPSQAISPAASLAYDLSAGSHRGRLYLSYTDENGPESDDTDLLIRHSDDDGQTWSDAARVNDDATRRSQFFPALAVDPTSGAVGLAWYDCRDDVGIRAGGYRDSKPNTEPVVWASASVDGGETFLPNFRVGPAPSSGAASGNPNEFGNGIGLGFFNGVLRPLWADNSTALWGNPIPAQFDIATAAVSLRSASGPRVDRFDPELATGPIEFVDIHFDRPMDAGSFSIQDDVAEFRGPGGIDLRSRLLSADWVDDRTLRLRMTPLVSPGVYRLTIGPRLLSIDGAAMDQNFDGDSGDDLNDRFVGTFSLAAPRVVAFTPSGLQISPVSGIEITFDQPMDAGGFSPAEDVLVFTGPRGVDLRQRISAWRLSDDGRRLRIEFDEQSREGSYALTLGSNLVSRSGLALNQDGDAVAGEPADDRFALTFQIDLHPGPDAFGYEARPAAYESVNLMPGGPDVHNVLGDGENEYAPISLGENTFNFYGRSWTGGASLFAGINGYLSFGQGMNGYAGNDLASAPPMEMIAVLWGDWSTSRNEADQVLYRFDDLDRDAKADRLVVQWNQVAHVHGAPGNAATFQAILSLNTGDRPGDILLNYPDFDVVFPPNDVGETTVGLRGPAKDDLLVIDSGERPNPAVKSGSAVLVSQRPRVVSTVVRGGAWKPAFLDRMKSDGLGDGGYELKTGTAVRLPWANIDQLIVRFDRPVQLSASALDIVSRSGGNADVASYAFDPITLTATWSFAAPIKADRLSIFLPDVSAPTAADAIWNIDVLPGDADRSGGAVSAAELVQVRNRVGRRADSGGFSVFADLNGSGVIDAADLVSVRNQIGAALPTAALFIPLRREKLEEDSIGG